MKSLFLLLTGIVIFNTAKTQSLTPSDADSKVSFVIKNIGMNVDGTLKGLKGKMYFDPKNLQKSVFDVTVDVNTINTDNQKRDNHLKTDDFFNAERYPVIQIKTSLISSKGNNTYFARADVIIRGVSKTIQFDFMALPQGRNYLFTGSFPLNRRDFGVGGASMILSDNLVVNLSVLGKK